jgi:hypothetical protein
MSSDRFQVDTNVPILDLIHRHGPIPPSPCTPHGPQLKTTVVKAPEVTATVFNGPDCDLRVQNAVNLYLAAKVASKVASKVDIKADSKPDFLLMNGVRFERMRFERMSIGRLQRAKGGKVSPPSQMCQSIG